VVTAHRVSEEEATAGSMLVGAMDAREAVFGIVAVGEVWAGGLTVWFDVGSR
jgi:hypothetical protein